MQKLHWAIPSSFLLLYLGVLSLHFFSPDQQVIHDNEWFHYRIFSFILSGLRHEGNFPLWIPYLNNGLPTIVLTNNWFTLLSTRYPIYLFTLLYSGPIDSLLLYKINLILECLALVWFMYLLLHELFGRGAPLYWGLALCLFTGISGITLIFEQIGVSTLFVPLILFLSIRLYRWRQLRYAVLLGIFLGHSLCNHYPHLVAYSLGIFLFLYLACHREVLGTLYKDRTFFLKASFLTLALCLVVMAPTLYAYFIFSSDLISPDRLNSLQGSWEWLMTPKGNRSLDPPSMLTYLAPWYGIASLQTPNMLIDKLAFFVGTFGILFFLKGLLVDFNRTKLFWLLSLVAIFLFAIGSWGFVYYYLYKYIPLSRLQRIPLHMGNYMNIPIIVVSCMGWKNFLSKAKYRSLIIIGIFLFQLLDSGFLFKYLTTKALQPDTIPTHVKTLQAPNLTFSTSRDPYWSYLERNNVLIGFAPAIKQKLGSKTTSKITLLPTGTVQEENIGFDGAHFKLQAPGEGLFSWQMNYAPQWEGFLDGNPVPIETKSGVELQVRIPKGEHLLVLRYRPWTQVAIIWIHVILVSLAWILLVSFTHARTSVVASPKGDAIS